MVNDETDGRFDVSCVIMLIHYTSFFRINDMPNIYPRDLARSFPPPTRVAHVFPFAGAKG